MGCEMLERSAVKVARSVLRGLGVGNDLWLLDKYNLFELLAKYLDTETHGGLTEVHRGQACDCSGANADV